MRVSEIRVNQIRVNQGLGVFMYIVYTLYMLVTTVDRTVGEDA